MVYYVYILQSQIDQSYYIGQTYDLQRRLLEHNEGLSKYTSTKRPWTIVYTEQYASRNEAMKREAFLKRQRNRKFYERLIKESE